MRSSGRSDGGRHSVLWLTRRTCAGSVASGFLAATNRPMKNRYSTPDGPGHWAEGSDDWAVKGLPRTPMFVVFIHTLPAVETRPGPLISGTACVPRGPPPPVDEPPPMEVPSGTSG